MDILQHRGRALNSKPLQKIGPILLWLSRDPRLHDNWAFLAAEELSNKFAVDLIVVTVRTNILHAQSAHYRFRQEGLKHLRRECQRLNINYLEIESKNPGKAVAELAAQKKSSAVVVDFSPLQGGRKWREYVAKEINAPLFEVDAHNIVPTWIASPKQEYSAATFRPKINSLLPKYFTTFPHQKSKPYPAGEQMMRSFLREQLQGYSTDRNDPNLDNQSNLSPWLHYGLISTHQVAEMVKNSNAAKADIDTFLEELIVRRELADNYCFYQPHYNSPKGYPRWAQESHREQKKIARPYILSYEQLESAQSPDLLWNAAQQQMLQTGKMHGYMRMYWAKQLLLWTPNVATAHAYALKLNDTYELDGRDPSGYTGIAWSLGGVHDRPWFRKPIWGLVRPMTANGLAKKFDTAAYIELWQV